MFLFFMYLKAFLFLFCTISKIHKDLKNTNNIHDTPYIFNKS